MTRSIPLFLMVAAMFTCLVRADDKPKVDLGKLKGDWKLVSFSQDGKDMPEDERAKMTAQIEEKGLSLTKDGKPDWLPITKVEKESIDFEADGHKMPGIYKLSNDDKELEICFIMEGDRPKELKGGEKMIYMKLKK
jgi:uncharacterized protein (TIGR03067 family)